MNKDIHVALRPGGAVVAERIFASFQERLRQSGLGIEIQLPVGILYAHYDDDKNDVNLIDSEALSSSAVFKSRSPTRCHAECR